MCYRSLLLFPTLTAILILGTSATPQRQGTPPHSEAEGLVVQRIVELWRDEQHAEAKEQMREFFEEYPESPFKERLVVLAGDHEWHHRNYVEAGEYYDQLVQPELLSDTLDRRLDVLYHTERYEDLLKALAGHLPPNGRVELSDREALRLFYYAEALLYTADTADDEEKALTSYQKLFNTHVGVQAKLRAANLLGRTGRPQEAVALYLALADPDSPNHDALLMHAVQLQVSYDAEGAAQTLAGLKDPTAARGGVFSQVFLLFQAGQYAELLQKRTQILEAVNLEQKSLIDFFMGRAAFALGHYQEAIDLLKPLLKGQSFAVSSPNNEKIVLVTLILSAQKRNRPEWAQKWLGRLEKEFPSDSMLSDMLMSQATLFHAKGQPLKALKVLERAQKRLSSEEDLEKAAYERIVLLYELQRWGVCYEGACDFGRDFPGSAMASEVGKLMIRMTAQQLQSDTLGNEERELLQERLSRELQTALSSGTLSKEEAASFLLHFAKSEYAQRHLDKAVAASQAFLEAYPRDAEAYQAHLILAYSYFDSRTALGPFISHAEEALALCPELPDQDVIHLNLFGAYLQRAKDVGEHGGGQSPNTSRAAEHLYTVLARGETPVKVDSLRWLAGFYYAQAREGYSEGYIQALPSSRRRDYAARAEQALRIALGNDDALDKQSLSEPLDGLQDLVMLSRLYGWLGQDDQRRLILEQLVSRPWPNTVEVRNQIGHLRLELGQRYEESGDVKKALKMYEQIASEAGDSDAYVRDATQLRLARLRFYSIPEERRRRDDPEVIVVLSSLQGLQARRHLDHEPVYLEAAYEGAHIAAAVLDGSDESLLTQLKQARRQIASKGDGVSRAYHAARQQDEGKDAMYQAYLMLFDARIARIEANLAANRHRIKDQRSKLLASEAIYNTLLQGNFAVSNYLVHQAQVGLEEIAIAKNE